MSDLLRTYWTNFAKTGDPNGAGLPRWPAFTSATPQMLHIASDTTKAGPIVSEDGLRILDEYFAWRRAPVVLVQEGPPPQPGRGAGSLGPAVVSPEVLPDRRITFRLLAPQAQNVRLAATDIFGTDPAGQLTKGPNGVWEITIGPLDAGAYRYTFNVDGVGVIDPRSPSISESNTNVWSLVYVPGADFMETKEVPHGAVSAITYYSTSLKRFRRMHVYTPPGYESGRETFPVLYLLHGAGDADESWTSVGRAGFILDNLIAKKQARPMVIVMPAGHTSQTSGVRGQGAADDFVDDFLQDILPSVEKTFRVSTERRHRAIAGLSMGGSQTLNIAIRHLDRFAYVGVFNSGLIGDTGGRGAAAAPQTSRGGPSWEQEHLSALDNASLKKGLRLLWFSTGKDDFLIATTRATVALFEKHGFTPVFKESAGGHTWMNWRNYLNEFAPQLFQ